MTTPTLKLELTVAEIDMAFVLFQYSRQDKYSFEDINVLMKKIQDQGRPQLEALAIKRDTDAALKQVKTRKPKAAKPAPVAEKQQSEKPVDAGIPDLSDLKLD